ncbi:MAG: hypothetical protein DMG39_16745 [Acidobacteria bacterium]|nr:MAG: hypothetical protein DMG39_16745 [Acidobacteriota bacterium]
MRKTAEIEPSSFERGLNRGRFFRRRGKWTFLSALKDEASKLQKQLNSINSAIEILGGKNSVGRGRKRRVSPSARGKMSRAQKARWAKMRAKNKNA